MNIRNSNIYHRSRILTRVWICSLQPPLRVPKPGSGCLSRNKSPISSFLCLKKVYRSSLRS